VWSSFVELAKLEVQDFGKLQLLATATFLGLCWTEAVFTFAEVRRRRFMPPPQLVTDLFYWMLIPMVRVVSRILVLPLLLVLALLIGVRADHSLFDGYGPLARQPTALILIEAVILTDLAAYWIHRLFHTVPWLWRFHAIHHSATEIRWSTTGRVHPFNEMLNYMAAVIPCFVIGLPINVVLTAFPVMVMYAVAAHTQWNLSFGPLKVVFASPRFHRWHHTHSHEGGNRNFANVFSFWDRLFGTHYLPEGRVAETFGLDHQDVPENYLGQLAYPFRRGARAASPADPLPASDQQLVR